MNLYVISIVLNNIFCTVMLMTIKTNNFSFDYVISFGNRCRTNAERFGFYSGYSITDCVLECALRQHCVSLSYIVTMNVCELYLSHGDEKSFRDGRCLNVLRSDITNIKIPCEECSYGAACDLSSKACRYKECLNVTVPANSVVVGNLRGVNDYLRIICDNGFGNIHGIVASKCMGTGQWSVKVECDIVCIEPKLENAYITAGDAFEGSVRNVTCYQNTIDDMNATFEIKCMADRSWKPEIVCLKDVIFRVIAGNGFSTIPAWKNRIGTTTDVHCRVISNTSCSGHYRDKRIDQWGMLNIKTVRYSIYKNFKEVAWIEFDGLNSNNIDWFDKSRIVNSSFTDISSTSTFNFLQLEPALVNLKRRFYLSVAFNGCDNDILYFVTIDSEGSGCWYDKIAPFPSIVYSILRTKASSANKDDFDYGDSAVVRLK